MTAIECERIARERWLMEIDLSKALEHAANKWGAMFAARAEVHRWKLTKLERGEHVFTG
jgi:hypothetical protein